MLCVIYMIRSIFMKCCIKQTFKIARLLTFACKCCENEVFEWYCLQ